MNTEQNTILIFVKKGKVYQTRMNTEQKHHFFKNTIKHHTQNPIFPTISKSGKSLFSFQKFTKIIPTT